ncbi:sensor domain-containing diguanylate cyclase [Hydrogenovibrio sp. 3SP14C1]|uniref:sensor domain-containing diguanylate cyclase n=1 Tax=Hydrogenovibrio sp. 3SP14C1 TaxID=3038774 RepID=UPI002417DBE8|nr:diguanylate cyclase [Hydrogenovibrio sp. 3SP14C1]MDG4812526.1 sensor domain-containing diguanylate cyclase [Hydrogenovibrio sp. 3SP14C1]
MFKIFSFLFLFLGIAFQANAVAPVDISQPQYQIGQSVLFFEDADNVMSFSDVEKVPDSQYEPVNNAICSNLFTRSTFYYKFEVLNPKNSTMDRLLVFETPWLDSIQVKVISPDQMQQTSLTGNMFPFKQRAAEHPYPNVEHLFEPGVSTVYLQVKTRDPFIVPISILDKESLFKNHVSIYATSMFIYGIIIAMILYHFILFASIQLRYYAYYVLYLMSFLAMNVSYNGYTFQFLLQDSPVIQNWIQGTTIFLFAIAGLLFAKAFLSLDKYIPLAHKLTKVMIWLFVSVMLITAFIGYHEHVMFAIGMSVIFSLYVFAIALLSYLKGNKTARFFLLGTTAGLVGTSITALTVMAVIPYSHMGYQAVDYGLAIDSILLSFALVDRVKSTEKEKLQAEVSANTDALTNVANRRAFNQFCEQLDEKSHKLYQENLVAMMLDIDFFKEINDTYGHSVGDIVLQKISNLLRSNTKSKDFIFRMGGEEFLILLPDTNVENAQKVAERIRASIEKMVIHKDDDTFSITTSIGVAEFLPEDKSFLSIIQLADKTLYDAKRTGRNKIVVAIR